MRKILLCRKTYMYKNILGCTRGYLLRLLKNRLLKTLNTVWHHPDPSPGNGYETEGNHCE